MRKTADAVIIGGGAIGTSVLYHLTRLGLRDVVLLEKGELSSGSSGDSAAIVRQHYSNEVSIRLVKKSLEVFQRFPEEFDGANVFTATGWFFLCPPEVAAIFSDNMAQLRRLGVRTWEVSVDEAAEMLPGLNPEGIGWVAFEPDSGHADPHAMANAFAGKATESGAEVYLHTSATDFEISNGRVGGVRSGSGNLNRGISGIAA